jgi:O-antigen/teichoic acid export membrane protein
VAQQATLATDRMTEEQGQDRGLSKDQVGDVSTVAKGGAIQVAGQISQRTLSFLFSAIAFRGLGPVNYGLYRIVVQVLTISGQLALAGYNYAAMRWIARARAAENPGGVRGAARVAMAGAIIGSAVVSAALFVFASPIMGVVGSSADVDNLTGLLRVGVIYVPLFAMMQVLRYCTQAYKTMVPSVVAGNIVQPAFRFVFGAAILGLGVFVWETSRQTLTIAVLLVLAISYGVGAFVAKWYFGRMMSVQERGASPLGEPKAMTKFALPQAGASLLGIQTLGLGILLLGRYAGPAEVAVFAIALSLQGPANVFLGGIVNIWAPMVSDLHERGDMARLDSLYKTINRWIFTFSFPVTLSLLIVPDFYLRVYAGEQGTTGATVVAVLAIGNLFYTGTGPTGYMISMTGHPHINLINSVVSVIAYVGLGVLVVPDHGALGMAAVDAGVTAAVNTVRVFQAHRLLGVQPYGPTFFKPVVAGLAGGALLLVFSLMWGSDILVSTAGLIGGAIVYLVALKLLGLDDEERVVLNGIRRQISRIGRKDKHQS